MVLGKGYFMDSWFDLHREITTKDKWFETHYKIIKDININNKEIKLMSIIELLSEESISRKKAFELCYEIGIFTKSPIEVDCELTEIWEGIYSKD